MARNQEPPAEQVAALREHLRALAEASGLPVPPLKVDKPRKQETMAGVREIQGEETVVVPRWLLDAGYPEQIWHLAGCLGWWSSPVPRQRHEQAWGVIGALLVAYLLLAFVILLPNDVPHSSLIGEAVVGLLVSPAVAAMSRRERRATDAAGRAVLAAAGHRPAEIARQVFGGQEDPGQPKRWFMAEPTPSERIAAATADPGRPSFR